jgi:predicted ArsR family transcriptional regulator
MKKKMQQTSLDTYESIKPYLNEQENKVAGYLAMLWPEGRTLWEMAEEMGMLHQSVSARCTDLHNKNVIIDSGKRRKTGTGHDAIVWRYNKKGNMKA